VSTVTGNPPRSALLAAWGNAWLAGDAALPELVERVIACDGGHLVHGLAAGSLPLERAVGRVRADGVQRLRLVLPAPGDTLGLPRPGPFTVAALDAGEDVLAPGPDPGPFLPDAEHDLRRGLLECAGVLRDLDVARWRPDLTSALADLRREARAGIDDDELPGGYPQRARQLLVRARQLAGVLVLAGEDSGGAIDTRETLGRELALRELARLVRRARVAGYNAYGQAR